MLCAIDPGRQGGAVRVEVGAGRPRVVGWAAWHPLTRGWRVSVGSVGGFAAPVVGTLGAVARSVAVLAGADLIEGSKADALAVEGLFVAMRQTPDGISPGDILPLAEAAGALVGAAEAACDSPARRPKPSEWRRAAWGTRWGRTAAEAKAAALRYAPLGLDWGAVAAGLEAAPLVACEREGIAEAAGIALWLAGQVGPLGAGPSAARQLGSAADPLGFDPDATGVR